MNQLEVDFQVTEHPHLGYKKEDRLDLEHAFSTDILHGAFMGNVVFRLPEADFSTPSSNAGWRGLVEWCLRLDALVRQLDEGRAHTRISEPDSDSYIDVHRDGQVLKFSSSGLVREGSVELNSFLLAARSFIGRSMRWIDKQYPAAKKNLSVAYVWERLDAYR
jgi:hypothetical protein